MQGGSDAIALHHHSRTAREGTSTAGAAQLIRRSKLSPSCWRKNQSRYTVSSQQKANLNSDVLCECLTCDTRYSHWLKHFD